MEGKPTVGEWRAKGKRWVGSGPMRGVLPTHQNTNRRPPQTAVGYSLFCCKFPLLLLKHQHFSQ